MKYLLDTDIIIDHIRGKKIIELDVLEDGAAISIITLGELIYGAYKSSDAKSSLSKLSQYLTSLGLQIENLDEQIISEFGKVKALLEKKGERLEDFDLLIASVAIVSNLTLVTRNIKHFERIKRLKLYRV